MKIVTLHALTKKYLFSHKQNFSGYHCMLEGNEMHVGIRPTTTRLVRVFVFIQDINENS